MYASRAAASVGLSSVTTATIAMRRFIKAP
jgi:hypothetical protein